jgi:uncharacterized protein YeaC (DUF1315 family)
MSTDMTDDLLALLENPPDSVAGLVAAISPAIYGNLKSAIELGKWDDGRRLERAQLEQCMQLLILYEAQALPEAERTGAELRNDCKSAGAPGSAAVGESGIIRILDSE